MERSMEVLLDQKTIAPLLLGAALALLGGVFTQSIFWHAYLAHSKNALLSAFRAELRIIRGTLGSSLAGYRNSLRAGDPPTPTVFSQPTPVFGANAGHLGQLRDPDLIEHIVEVYSSLQSLSEQASLYKGAENSAVNPRDLNAMHLSATIAHVQIMKLHNRLTKIPSTGKINLDQIEVESQEHFAEHAKLLEAGQIDVILSKRWHDA
nr:putative integron gene cassette protein [uncultured bacterium]